MTIPELQEHVADMKRHMGYGSETITLYEVKNALDYEVQRILTGENDPNGDIVALAVIASEMLDEISQHRELQARKIRELLNASNQAKLAK